MAVLVGKAAPDFTAVAVMGDNDINESFNLSAHIKGKYAVVFFWPLDFTFVCPSELIAFDHRLQEFKDRQVEVIGVSIDSHFTHLAWKNTPVNQGGIGKVGYPMGRHQARDLQGLRRRSGCRRRLPRLLSHRQGRRRPAPGGQ